MKKWRFFEVKKFLRFRWILHLLFRLLITYRDKILLHWPIYTVMRNWWFMCVYLIVIIAYQLLTSFIFISHTHCIQYLNQSEAVKSDYWRRFLPSVHCRTNRSFRIQFLIFSLILIHLDAKRWSAKRYVTHTKCFTHFISTVFRYVSDLDSRIIYIQMRSKKEINKKNKPKMIILCFLFHHNLFGLSSTLFSIIFLRSLGDFFKSYGVFSLDFFYHAADFVELISVSFIISFWRNESKANASKDSKSFLLCGRIFDFD